VKIDRIVKTDRAVTSGCAIKPDRGAGSFLFAALIPHRNAISVLEKFRQQLFAAGLDGAFSFPAAAPLALLSRPLTETELKTAAVELRKLLGDKKMVISALPETSFFSGGMSFFGPRLNLPFPALPESAVISRWEKPVLAPAVLGSGGAEFVRVLAGQGRLPAPPELSFRAAALSNLSVYPAGNGEADYSYAWAPDRLYWLPNPRRTGRG
jgi:hypothetical protein